MLRKGYGGLYKAPTLLVHNNNISFDSFSSVTTNRGGDRIASELLFGEASISGTPNSAY